MQFTAQQIAVFLNGTIEGNAEVSVETFGGIEAAGSNAITFLANLDYEEYLYQSEAAVVVISNDFQPQQKVKPVLIRVENPYLAMSQLMKQVQAMKQEKGTGVHQTAVIDESVKIPTSAFVGAYSVISKEVVIGEGTQIYPQVFLGAKVQVGKNCILYPGVKIYHDCIIGDGCIIHSGAIIGADGFGFAPDENGKNNKIPQLGNVVIGNEVEIGANTCIDRATFDSTIIEDGVKLDNLIQVGHNVKIGENSIVCGQVGIAGSSTVGKNCLIAGQAALSDHITLADGIKVGAMTGVSKSFTKENEVLLGIPAKNYRETVRNFAYINNLSEMSKRIKMLEKALLKKD